MCDPVSAAVVLDAAQLLERCSRSPLASDDRRNCERLALRMRDLLIERARVVPDDIASAAEARWAKDPGVKLQRPLAMRADGDGIFVAGWLRAGQPLDDREGAMAIEAALVAMPVVAREVFVLHRRHELSFAAIGERLALTVDEVAEQFIVALLAISAESRRRVADRRSTRHKP